VSALRDRGLLARSIGALLFLVPILLAIPVVNFISSTPNGVASESDWSVDDFHADIVMNSDASIEVVETIQADFSVEKHGIFRDIPIIYNRTGDLDHYRLYDLAVRSVTNEKGEARQYVTNVVDRYLQVKIGDPNVLVTGKQVYRIAYHVVGALNSFADHDELYWNVAGPYWPVPISRESATVGFPSGYQRSACYQGFTGSTTPCAKSVSGHSARFSETEPGQSGEQLTIVVALAKGAIAAPSLILGPRPPAPFDTRLQYLLPAIAVLLVGGAVLFYLYWSRVRDQAYLSAFYQTGQPADAALTGFRHQPVIVEYEAPPGLKPAEAGVLLDLSADSKDLAATILDLARRGHLTLSSDPSDWTLTRVDGASVADLSPYEAILLNGLFATGGTVKLNDLKGTVYGVLQKAEDLLYQDTVTNQWFVHRPDQVRHRWTAFAVMIMFGAVMVACGAGAFGFGMTGVALGLVGAALLVLAHRMPGYTAAGRALLMKVLGFRLYMNTAERYRQQFAEQTHIFTDLLPYAIVFGCVKQWAAAFQGLDVATPARGWYSGAGQMQAMELSDRFENFNGYMSSSMATMPAPVPGSGGSSSGFSFGGSSGGGGFSGGGGGGGGGGSW
jgi:uncharacterized membrane protein YgcG